MPLSHLGHFIFLKEEQDLIDFLGKWLLTTTTKEKSHLVGSPFKILSGAIHKLKMNFLRVPNSRYFLPSIYLCAFSPVNHLEEHKQLYIWGKYYTLRGSEKWEILELSPKDTQQADLSFRASFISFTT